MIRHPGSKFNERVVEKRHPALDGTGHAHLILLHQQFHKICLLVGKEHLGEGGRSAACLPMLKVGCVRVRSIQTTARQHRFSLRGRKCSVEVIELKSLYASFATKECMLQLPPQVTREKR